MPKARLRKNRRKLPRIQVVLTEPAKKFVGKYRTKSGQKKNRYIKNPDSMPIVHKGKVHTIKHYL